MARVLNFASTSGGNEVRFNPNGPESAVIKLYFGDSRDVIVSLSVEESVSLRDQLSAAILEAATAAAKAKVPADEVSA